MSASADLLHRLVLLGAMALLRLAIDTRVKREERSVRVARKRRNAL